LKYNGDPTYAADHEEETSINVTDKRRQSQSPHNNSVGEMLERVAKPAPEKP
jgi:hypothetical protein